MSATHAQWETLLADARVGVHASDLHGSLVGYLCGGGHADAAHVLGALQLEHGGEASGQRFVGALEDLHRESVRALDDEELGFEPLLPTDDAALPQRADALVEWCRGFLGGFGLAGPQRPGALSDEGQEVLRDFGTIAGSSLEYGDGEEDERSLMEVAEFVRVGVLLLRAEVMGRKVGDAGEPGPSVH